MKPSNMRIAADIAEQVPGLSDEALDAAADKWRSFFGGKALDEVSPGLLSSFIASIRPGGDEFAGSR